MAHWISSKLKAAETLLQQIDQQAAESLRKNDNQTIDDQLVTETSSKIPETKSLIKDLLKKKSAENVVGPSIIPGDKRDLSITSRSNSDFNQDDEAKKPLNSNSKLNLSARLTESDWTELLSVPDKRSVIGAGIMTQSSNRLPMTRTLRKNGKKLGSFGQGMNLSAGDGRTEMVGNNGVLKNSRRSNVRLDSNINIDGDAKSSNVEDGTPRNSSVLPPSSGGESDQRDCTPTHMFSTVEGANDITDGEKLHFANDSDYSSHNKSLMLDRELDMKVGSNDSDRLETAISGTNRSKVGSSASSSKKKVSSLPSEGESNSETDSISSSDSESEREREESRKRKQQILAEKAAAKAIEAIKERENLVARLEGEKQSLEKMFEERAKQQVLEASELQTTMMETMEAVDVEKQKHNNTRMEVLARLAKLEGENADLARSLANVQKNLEIEADHIAELRHQIHLKEATSEELRRELSSIHPNGDKSRASKGVEFEMEMLEAEYSFVADKVARMQVQAKTIETSIETTRREIDDHSEVEFELKRRLSQLTDHLIQKQAQVETLSSEKAMLHFRIEAILRLLEEHKSSDFHSTSEQGAWQLSNSKFRSLLEGRMQLGQQHFGSLVRQLDSLFCTGAMFLRRNSKARIWCIVYLACLHLWVIYIITSHSPVSEDLASGAVVSLENINNTGAI